MTQVGKIVLAALILTLAQGCADKKTKAKIPPQAQAPATEESGALYPPPFPEKTETPPVVPEPTKPDVVPAPKPAPQKFELQVDSWPAKFVRQWRIRVQR